LKPAKAGTAPGKQVISLISHSDGINPFLKTFGWKDAPIENPGYCATFCVEIEVDDLEKEGYKVLAIEVL